MKQSGFAPILIILVILVLGAIVFFAYQNILGNAYKGYNNENYHFSLSYPKDWYVNELGKDAITSRGVYFSPEKVDFTNSFYSAPKGFVRISVYETKEMFRSPKYVNKTYTSAQQLLEAMQQEEKVSVAADNLPSTPGPPTSKGTPKKQFSAGAISIDDIQIVGNPNDFLYWIVKDGKLYEFLVNYPSSDKDFAAFDEDVNEMTSTFRILN